MNDDYDDGGIRERDEILKAFYVPPLRGRLRASGRAVWNWFSYWGFILIGAAVFLTPILWVAITEGRRTERIERDWMNECVMEHKHYECVAMWRAGEDHNKVIPVFIPMPSGR